MTDSPYTTGYATNSGFAIGDSLMGSEWDVPLRNYFSAFENRKSGGKGFVGGVLPNITTQWNTYWPARAADCDWVVLQGGVNDIKSFSITVAQMKTAFQLILDDAIADVGADRIIVWNISPWGTHASWTVPYQAMTVEWNTWLAAQAIVQGFILVDMYAALGDPANPEDLAPEYDSGDGIHPNAAGTAVHYDLMMNVLTAGNFLDMVSRMNTINQCVGAVEPSTFNHVGNEMKTWVGASQPVWAAVSVLQNQTVGANYAWNDSRYGLVLLDRTLTVPEAESLTTYLEGKAGLP
jgi:lysophospholipase L1-like esterase